MGNSLHSHLCVDPVQSTGDVICSKAMPGARKVFRLEAVLEAGVDELYDILFTRVEEMHQWNPSIQRIKVIFGKLKIPRRNTLAEAQGSEGVRSNVFILNMFVSCRRFWNTSGPKPSSLMRFRPRRQEI